MVRVIKLNYINAKSHGEYFIQRRELQYRD